MNPNSTEILWWRLSPTPPSTFMNLESLRLNWSVLYYMCIYIESFDIHLTKKVITKDITSIVKAYVVDSMFVRLFVHM